MRRNRTLDASAVAKLRRWQRETKLVFFPPSTIDEVSGSLRYDGPPLTLEDMDAAITREAIRRAREED